jgi:hypothetical protein
MKRIALIVPLCLSLLHPAVAGSIPTQEIPADAKWLLHLDAGQFRASKVGGYFITEMLEKQLSRPMQELQTKFKLDVNLEKIIGGINSITIYGTDYQSAQDHAVLLIRTSPEIEKILVGFLAGMALAGTNAPVQVTQSQEGNVSFYDIKNAAYCAVLPGKVIAVGRSREITEKAAKVLAGQAPALTSGAAFGGFGDTKEAFFFLGVAEGFNAGNGLPPQAKLLQVADAGRVAVGEDAKQLFLNLALRGKTPEAVMQMQQVMQGILAIGSLSQPQDKDVAQLLQSVKVSTTDNFVNVHVEYPADRAIEQLAHANMRVQATPAHPATVSIGFRKDTANPPDAAEKETPNSEPPTAPSGGPGTN